MVILSLSYFSNAVNILCGNLYIFNFSNFLPPPPMKYDDVIYGRPFLVILAKPEGDKYKYAKKWKIPCVTSAWVFDSVEKGYCLNTEGYR